MRLVSKCVATVLVLSVLGVVGFVAYRRVMEQLAPKKVAAAAVEKWFQMGHDYLEGQGVQKDYAQAVKWYRKAAEQGHAGAMFCLGVLHQGRNILALLGFHKS